jgi:phage FluMu gp28-like protein
MNNPLLEPIYPRASSGESNPEPLLLPYQEAWVADRAPVKVCEKSRRARISWAEAADSALTAAGADGMDVWYIGYNREMALEFINDTAFWTTSYGIAATDLEETLVEDKLEAIVAFRIRFASGFRVTALSSRPSNLRGKQGKVVIDEAAFHGDLAELLKAAVALLMWGGRVAVISTHNGEDNPFNELVNDIRAGKKPYSLHRITLDEALREGLFKRICLKSGKGWSEEAEAVWRQELIDFYGEFADEELFCIPSRGSGTWLPRAVVEACMDGTIPVLRWTCTPEFAQEPEHVRSAAADRWCEENLWGRLSELPEDRPCYFGEDFGRSGDLTVITPLQEEGVLHYRAPCLVELRNVPYRQQEQVLFFLADHLPRFSGGALDARGNGHYLAEVAMQRYGSWRIRQVMLSDRWYLENMPSYRAAFEDRSITLPKDPDVLDDHRALRMEKGIAKVPENYRARGRDGGRRHADAAIACALAWYAARRIDGGPVEYEQVDQRQLTGRGY